jgi:hypothetical protein
MPDPVKPSLSTINPRIKWIVGAYLTFNCLVFGAFMTLCFPVYQDAKVGMRLRKQNAIRLKELKINEQVMAVRKELKEKSKKSERTSVVRLCLYAQRSLPILRPSRREPMSERVARLTKHSKTLLNLERQVSRLKPDYYLISKNSPDYWPQDYFEIEEILYTVVTMFFDIAHSSWRTGKENETSFKYFERGLRLADFLADEYYFVGIAYRKAVQRELLGIIARISRFSTITSGQAKQFLQLIESFREPLDYQKSILKDYLQGSASLRRNGKYQGQRPPKLRDIVPGGWDRVIAEHDAAYLDLLGKLPDDFRKFDQVETALQDYNKTYDAMERKKECHLIDYRGSLKMAKFVQARLNIVRQGLCKIAETPYKVAATFEEVDVDRKPIRETTVQGRRSVYGVGNDLKDNGGNPDKDVVMFVDPPRKQTSKP